jgi:hypothetical protein
MLQYLWVQRHFNAFVSQTTIPRFTQGCGSKIPAKSNNPRVNKHPTAQKYFSILSVFLMLLSTERCERRILIIIIIIIVVVVVATP